MRYRTGVHHRFEADGQAFAYAAASAAVVGLDELAGEVLEHFDGPEGAELDAWLAAGGEDGAARREAFEELVAMRLVAPLGEVPPPADELPPMPYPLATLVLNVTNKCNLACTYCYEYGEDRIAEPAAAGRPRAPRMTPETARRSIDFLYESSGGRRDLTVTFFGGETLLNVEAIRAAVLHAEQRAASAGKRVSFALTTNATLLTDELIDFLVEHRLGVNVSIDGDAAEQDRHRTFADGRGSYARIAPRIKRLIERNGTHGRPIGARVTLTRGMASIRDTYRHLTEELGFAQVGFAPVTSAPDHDYALDGGALGRVLAEFGALAEDYVSAALAGRQHGFSNVHDLVSELHQGINKAHPCGAGLGLVGVSTEGELSPCHRFVESGAHALGDVERGLDAERRADFLRAGHISQKLACHDCFARPHCSGGCYHEAYVRYHDAAQPNLHYCEWVRAWTALGLRTYARIAVGNPEYLARFESAQPTESNR